MGGAYFVDERKKVRIAKVLRRALDGRALVYEVRADGTGALEWHVTRRDSTVVAHRTGFNASLARRAFVRVGGTLAAHRVTAQGRAGPGCDLAQAITAPRVARPHSQEDRPAAGHPDAPDVVPRPPSPRLLQRCR